MLMKQLAVRSAVPSYSLFVFMHFTCREPRDFGFWFLACLNKIIINTIKSSLN